MAERRMFSKAIVNSSKFLRMPPSSRLLYYDLGMAADDDGVVEAFTVIRMTGAAEDDLRVLHAKGFVIVLNDDLVTYIKDWNQNNQIRADRYHEGFYKDLLVRLSDGNQLTTKCQPTDNQMATEVSIGKSSIDKTSLGKSSLGKGSVDNTPLPPQGEEAPNLEEMFGYNQFLLEAVNDWLAYKKEKNQKYKPVGLKTLLTTIQNNVSKYGEDAVTELIRDSMSANYQGITWDRLKNQRSQNGGKKAPSFYDMWKEEKQNDERTDAETAFPF